MGWQTSRHQFTGLPETGSGERRLRVRRSLFAPVYVGLGENNGGIIGNISETGMALSTAQPVLEDLLSHLSFQLPELDRVIETGGDIVWKTESKKEVGIRFVDLREEFQAEIRNWVSPTRANGKSQESKEHRCNVEDRLSIASTAIATPAQRACREPLSQSRRLPEPQRTRSERMFPSENVPRHSREASASKKASQSEPVAETASSAISSTRSAAPERLLTNTVQSEFAPHADSDRGLDDTSAIIASGKAHREYVVEPRLYHTLGATLFRTDAADSLAKARSGRAPRVMALLALVAVTCFALGFATGPDVLRCWRKAQDVRQMTLEKLNRFRTTITNSDVTIQNAPSAATRNSNVPSSSEGGFSASSAPTVGENMFPDPALNNKVPGDGATALEEKLDKQVSGVKKTDEKYNSTAEHFVLNGRAKPRLPKKPIFTPNLSVKSDPTVNVATAPLRPPNSTPTPSEKTHDIRPTLPKKDAMAPSDAAKLRPTPSDVPLREGTATSQLVTPPANAAEPSPRSANPPPSFFLIVAPAAGNVPRLLELPPETVIDSAKVLIQSRQFVFVPAEPGPESSHSPEKIQIGERISKVVPAYPLQAAQRGMGGTVHLHATIGKDGRVESVRPINGPLLLIPTAIDAVRQWRYRPTLLDQQPTEMQEEFTIEFRPLE